jgi:hypothetical protein
MGAGNDSYPMVLLLQFSKFLNKAIFLVLLLIKLLALFQVPNQLFLLFYDLIAFELVLLKTFDGLEALVQQRLALEGTQRSEKCLKVSGHLYDS